MNLIPCPACERQLSAMAPSCPQCGHPMALNAVGGPAKSSAGRPTTIEQTSKKYKAGQLVGVAGICAGVVLYIGNSLGLGVLLMVAGAAIYAGSRLGAWWNNG